MKAENKTFKHKWPLPLIGLRMIKTAVAVFICLVIHVLRGYEGMVGESCIAAIICLQPYVKESWKTAWNRVRGTAMGGVWGLLFLLLMEGFPEMGKHMISVYLIMAIGVILALYSCVVLKVTDSASLAAIVFICVIVGYPDVDPPLVQAFNRIFDTIIGVFVALIINSIHIPTVKQEDKVFFLQLKHLAADRYSRISSRVLIELNHLYDAGARICLETEYAPAFLIGQLQTVHVNMPLIVMGGAALYDIRENLYTDVQAICHEDADFLYEYLNSLGLCGCIFTIRGNSMLLFHSSEKSVLEEENYKLMRRSPYRNYIDGKYQDEDQILAFRIICGELKGVELDARFKANPEIQERFHVVKMKRPLYKDQVLFYFYRRDVSIENAEKRLLAKLRKEDQKAEPVRIHPISAVYDPERDASILISRIRWNYLRPVWARKSKGKRKSDSDVGESE